MKISAKTELTAINWLDNNKMGGIYDRGTNGCDVSMAPRIVGTMQTSRRGMMWRGVVVIVVALLPSSWRCCHHRGVVALIVTLLS